MSNKPWARLRKHGPCMIFDWHETEELARQAIEEAVLKLGEQVRRFHVVAYFPDDDPNRIKVETPENSAGQMSAESGTVSRDALTGQGLPE